jgi:DNA modification methylase
MISSTGAERRTAKLKVKGNVFYYPISLGGATKDKFAFKHPAIFPEKLAEDHIISWSNENDIVYDCFSGSGTTAKMSIINNRNWIASEMSTEYCEIIKERIKIDKGLFENAS